jgi:hypothetical protein
MLDKQGNHDPDHTSQVIDSINLFIYSGLIGTSREYILDNFGYKGRLDCIKDDNNTEIPDV